MGMGIKHNNIKTECNRPFSNFVYRNGNAVIVSALIGDVLSITVVKDGFIPKTVNSTICITTNA